MTDTDEDKDTRTYTRAEQVRNLRHWAAALRTGFYTQGVEKLIEDTDGEPRFCCIGVASRLFGAELEKTGASNYSAGCTVWRSTNSGLDDSSIQVPEVREACGLTKDDLRFLADRNDAGRNFNQIADDLERWAEGLEWVAALEEVEQ